MRKLAGRQYFETVNLPVLQVTTQQSIVTERRGLFCRSALKPISVISGFDQTAIVLRYSAHIKPRKTITIKTIKTENISHKHNITLIVSS